MNKREIQLSASWETTKMLTEGIDYETADTLLMRAQFQAKYQLTPVLTHSCGCIQDVNIKVNETALAEILKGSVKITDHFFRSGKICPICKLKPCFLVFNSVYCW